MAERDVHVGHDSDRASAHVCPVDVSDLGCLSPHPLSIDSSCLYIPVLRIMPCCHNIPSESRKRFLSHFSEDIAIERVQGESRSGR